MYSVSCKLTVNHLYDAAFARQVRRQLEVSGGHISRERAGHHGLVSLGSAARRVEDHPTRKAGIDRPIVTGGDAIEGVFVEAFLRDNAVRTSSEVIGIADKELNMTLPSLRVMTEEIDLGTVTKMLV